MPPNAVGRTTELLL